MKNTFLAWALALMMTFAAGASYAAETGGTLVVGQLNVPKILYGGVQSGIAVAVPSTQLFASPVRYTDSYKPIPYLAKSWNMSKDGLTLTLNLVHNATFTDGKPVTSADVKFSIQVVKQYHPFGKQIWGSLESIDTPDQYTVVIHFSAPSPAVMIGLAPGLLPILPKHVYGQTENLRTDPRLARDVVGSGPYQLVSYQVGQTLIMKRRDDFFLKGEPKLDRIIIKYFNDATTAELALERGAINFLTAAEPTNLLRAKKDEDLVVAKKGYEALGALIWLEFNTKNKYLKDVKVRQALAYATDVNFLINKLQGGFSKRSPSPIATGSPFFDPNVPAYDYNPKKAEELLDQAGLAASANGTRFALHLTYDPGASAFGSDIANALKSQWEKIGVRVTIDSSPDEPTWGSRVANYNYDVTVNNVWNWADPAIGVARTYICSNIHKGVVWANMSQYCNKKVDALFAKAATEPDEARRKKEYFEVQEILTRDLPVYVMMNWPLTNVYSKNVSDPPNGIWGLMAPLLNTSVSQ